MLFSAGISLRVGPGTAVVAEAVVAAGADADPRAGVLAAAVPTTVAAARSPAVKTGIAGRRCALVIRAFPSGPFVRLGCSSDAGTLLNVALKHPED
jgi:hypothetical protein